MCSVGSKKEPRQYIWFMASMYSVIVLYQRKFLHIFIHPNASCFILFLLFSLNNTVSALWNFTCLYIALDIKKVLKGIEVNRKFLLYIKHNRWWKCKRDERERKINETENKKEAET